MSSEIDHGIKNGLSEQAAGNGIVASKKLSSNQVEIYATMTNGHKPHASNSNGVQHYQKNGYFTSDNASYDNGNPITIIRDSVSSVRIRILKEFNGIDDALLDTMTIEIFSDYITRQRLSSMPHRGSLWDRVLRWAGFYALQISVYAENIASFVPESRIAATQIFTLLRSLLELGEENASALNITFGVFNKLGLSLSFLSSHQATVSLMSHVREDVGLAFYDVHTLVFDVASYYQRSVRGLSNGSVTVDFIGLFRKNLESFYKRKSSIVDHMWRHSLGGHSSKDIKTIRNWLNQNESLLKAISTDSHTYISQYHEYTCEWFQRHLLEFTRGDEDILAITAPAGCGKTVLSNWIQQRLQRPMDRKTYSTVMFTFEADIPRQTTTLALAKGLALQLLHIRVGNSSMFELLVAAFDLKDSAAVEEKLWDAMDAAFDKSSEPTMIIIDGLDHVQGGHVAAINKRLLKLSNKHPSLKAIILSRPNEALLHSNSQVKSFVIKPDYVYEDIRHIAGHVLRKCEHFIVQNEKDRQISKDHLVKTANGSFLWLLLTVKILRKSTSIEDFKKTLADTPKTLEEILKKLAGFIDYSDMDTKLILSFLSITERPMTLSELYDILQINVKEKPFTNRSIDLKDKISKMNGVLLVTETGVVRFRHSALRSHFIILQAEGKKLLGMKDAQTELTKRLLAYSKLCLTKKHEVSLEKLALADVERLFSDHKLMEYAVRTWTYHFQHSSLYKPSGSFELASDFKTLFPSSTYMTLLEWTCWGHQTSKHNVAEMHDLALRIRTIVFDQTHICTLQNVITCGFVSQESSSVVVAANYFFQASHIGQSILSKFNKITFNCTEIFLSITEKMTFSSRTEIVTHREEMLKYIIAVYKHEHGEASDLVIRYYKLLAELYVSINEEEKATIIWKELRIIIVKKHGEGSSAEREITGKLMVVLKGKNDVEIEKYSKDIFGVGGYSEDIWDKARILIVLQLASGCENREAWYEAEEIYVTLWTCLLHQEFHDIELRISVLTVAIEYSRFLDRRGRHEEAKNILIIIWTENQHSGCEHAAFYDQLIIIGNFMRKLGLLTISISVFEKIVQWYKAFGKYDHEVVHRCEGYIVQVVEEMTEQEAFHREETTEEIETTVRRMLSSTTVATKKYISTTRTAVHLYIKKEQWAEAITVLTKSLSILWTESSWGGEVCLPSEFVDEAIEFALELGKCHMKSKHYHESLAVYLLLWQAVRTSCDFHDKRRTVIVETLIGFYTEHKRWKLLIELHKVLLIEYRRYYGKSHAKTIKILYFLGELVLEHGHGYIEDYYQEIVEVVGTVDFKPSFKAYKMLCQIYYDESRWVELKGICDVLWKLLVEHYDKYDFDMAFVELLYVRYIYVLRCHYKCDHKLRVKITLEYKNVCVLKYKSTSSIAIRAMCEYASVLTENETTKAEAINAYEEIITVSKTNKTVIDETSLSNIKRQLTETYMYLCSNGSSSTATMERAITILQERYDHIKISLGFVHKETLAILSELILMHVKLQKADHKKVIVQKLRQTVIEIVSKEKRSQLLYEAAISIGTLYITCGLLSQGLELIELSRRQIIASHTRGNKDTLVLDKSVGRVSFVFLVALELTLKGSVNHNYSELMADWLTESVLYDNYSRSLRSQTKIEILLTRSAHLRHFWTSHNRHEEISTLEQDVFDVFYKQYGTIVKTEAEVAKIFLISMLIHLGSRELQNVQIATIASLSGNEKIEEMLKASKYVEAHKVGVCTFNFVMNEGGYHKQPEIIGYGFRLAGFMAGRGAGAGAIPTDIRTHMLETSRDIMVQVLHACKDQEVNFLKLHDHELNDLVELLGEQENYKELHTILESLWKSRHGQKHWSEDTLIELGERLIESRHLAGLSDKDGHSYSHAAIHLAEDITYNLRRVLGGLNAHTLALSKLLSQLYTDAKQYGDAINVHEEILQLIVSGDDGDDRTTDLVTAEIAREHLDLLKAAYQRNERWVKSASTYETLVSQLLVMDQFRNAPEFRDVQPVQKWKAKSSEADTLGTFVKPRTWKFIIEDKDVHLKHTSGLNEGKSSPETTIRKRQSGWSLDNLRKVHGMNGGGSNHFKARPIRVTY